MIEGLFALRRSGFEGFKGIPSDLDLVEVQDQITHDVELDQEDIDPQTNLDVFNFDPDYQANEEKYQEIKKEILGDDEGEEAEAGASEEEQQEEAEGEGQEEGAGGEAQAQRESLAAAGQNPVVDLTEAQLKVIRKNIYLTLMSSLNYEECVHKLLKQIFKPGLEVCARAKRIERRRKKKSNNFAKLFFFFLICRCL